MGSLQRVRVVSYWRIFARGRVSTCQGRKITKERAGRPCLGQQSVLYSATNNGIWEGALLAIGDLLRGARLASGLSLAQVGELTGLSASTVSRAERFGTRPSADKIAQLFGPRIERMVLRMSRRARKRTRARLGRHKGHRR